MASRRAVSFVLGLGLLSAVGVVAMTVGGRVWQRGVPLSTGKYITPQGEATDVGSFPANMIVSPDGKYVIVTNIGYRQQISVIDAATGALVDKADFGDGKAKTGLYYGLTFGPEGTLYASRGAEDKISSYGLSTEGKLEEKTVYNDAAPQGAELPNHVAGIAIASDGKTLLAVNNQTGKGTNLKGSLSLIDLQSNSVTKKIELPGFPFGVQALKSRPKAYVSSERDGVVSAIDLTTGMVKDIRTGENPTVLLLGKDDKKLYVSNSNSDTLTVIDTATDRAVKTILLHPPGLRGYPGSTPLGIALSGDEKSAYVAMADLNAVAVVDLERGRLSGYLPTGWYPTAVAIGGDGKSFFVANAKGMKAQNPNGKPVGKLGQYVLNIMEGAVTKTDLTAQLKNLVPNTDQVLENNRAQPGMAKRLEESFKKPPIEHVIYIVKENRTYDQVLGDLPRGNGDPSLCLFPKEITPNLHALAERFVLLDNFHVCAEVSADGWNWSTSGMANEYTSRNSVYNYAGRGRNYDFEGTNNGIAVDRQNLHDVATAPGGYIWDQAKKQKVSYRNYGFFLTFDADSDDKRETKYEPDNAPDKKALYDATEPTFKRYDTSYADSEAWVKYGLSPAPKQATKFGKLDDKSRMTSWLRDYDRLCKDGNMPKMMTVRLGRDHTAGTGEGQYSPRAMVADNDYAVGQLVEAVSKGPYWKTTAIFVVEDDAQAGFDHVDAHRSIAFVISPYTKRSSVDGRFYNTDSVLRTMSLILGLKPWNQYIATAFPMNVFDMTATNAEPYTAILPKKEIVGEINSRNAYRAKDSERLIDRYEEESLSDMELNDILWGSIKGAKTPRPKTPGAVWRGLRIED